MVCGSVVVKSKIVVSLVVKSTMFSVVVSTGLVVI